MKNLNDFQRKFFEAISDIQKFNVGSSLCRSNLSTEELLYDMSSNIIIDIMALLDGYGKLDDSIDVVNRLTGENLKANPKIELHDLICDYIRQK